MVCDDDVLEQGVEAGIGFKNTNDGRIRLLGGLDGVDACLLLLQTDDRGFS